MVHPHKSQWADKVMNTVSWSFVEKVRERIADGAQLRIYYPGRRELSGKAKL